MKSKYILACLLCLILCTGCEEETLKQTNNPEKEFGELQSESVYGDEYLSTITYPKTGYDDLDEAIKTSIQEVQSSFQSVLEISLSQTKSELHIDYDSYIKENRYISVILKVYSRVDETKEEVITHTYDTKTKDLVNLSDLCYSGYDDTLKTLIHNELKNKYVSYSLDEEMMFEHFTLRKSALESYVSLTTGIEKVRLPYIDIEDVCSFEMEQELVFVPYDQVLNEPTKFIDPDKPMIALTFDDGPIREYTEAILDALKENNASATFFVLGSRVNNAPDLLQRMILEGNEIGNHTFSHKQLSHLSRENIKKEIAKTQDVIFNITHQYPDIIRIPYGEVNNNIMEETQDYTLVKWSVDTLDWKSQNTKVIVNHVMKNVKDGDIILMHDSFPSTAEAAKILIPALQEAGYQLVTVSELNQYR